MLEFTAAILLLVLGGLAAVLLGARSAVAQAAGQIGAISGSLLGLLVAVRAVVTGLYGRSYLAGGDNGRGSAATWFHLNLLTAAMALVITARDGLLFLLAWEIMALAPFFLVIFDDRQASVRHAAWTYLAATHLGTAFLLRCFVMVGGLCRAAIWMRRRIAAPGCYPTLNHCLI